MNFIFKGLGAVVLIALTGCLQVTVTSSLFSVGSDLKFKTNVVQRADLPVGLKGIEVENRFGDIEIIGSDSENPTWSWNLKVNATDEMTAREAIRAAACVPEQKDGKLRLVVSLPDSKGKFNFRSDLKLRVPKSVSVRTRTAYGATRISLLNGDIDAGGESGMIEIRAAHGNVRAETSYATLTVSDIGPAVLKNRSGSIEANGVSGTLDAETTYAKLTVGKVKGALTLKNQSGSIDASEIIGNVDLRTSYASLTVKTVTGNAILKNQSGSINVSGINGNVRADTSYAAMNIESAGQEIVCHDQSGSIDVRSTSTKLLLIDAKTSYASLDVALPHNLTPAIQAHTSYAEITSDFPVLLKPAGQDPFADLPESTPRIKLNNQSGRIRVTRE